MKVKQKEITINRIVTEEVYSPSEEQAIKHLHLALSDLIDSNYSDIKCSCPVKSQIDTRGFINPNNPYIYINCKCGYYSKAKRACGLAEMAMTITDLYGKVR